MLFSKAQTNTGRQVELDLMKAFTVVFSMIIIHVFDYDAYGFENKFTWAIDTIFGGIFAAPMFMFCMGLGTEYSRNNSPRQMALRGLKLLTVGQILNFFRYFLILIVKGFIEQEYDFIPAHALNFSSDILQLAGLSFLLLGLLCHLRMKNWHILLFAVALSLAGTLLEHVQTGCYGFDQFLGFFWGTDTESFFPLFNWFIFIAAGRCFGVLYRHLSNKPLFFLISIPVGVLVFAAIWYLQKHSSCGLFNSFDEDCFGFSWMRLPDAVSVLLLAPVEIGIFYLLSQALPEKAINVMSHPSKHINQYYCVSWVWIMLVYLDAWATSTEALISVWMNIVALTIITVVVYNRYLKERTEAVCTRHRTLLTVLVWAITLGSAGYSFAVSTEFPNQFNGYLLDDGQEPATGNNFHCTPGADILHCPGGTVITAPYPYGGKYKFAQGRILLLD